MIDVAPLRPYAVPSSEKRHHLARILIMKRAVCLAGVIGTLFVAGSLAADNDPSHLLQPAERLKDGRLGKPKTLNDYFPFVPLSSKEAWEARRKVVRERVLVATGLWPMPEKGALNPVIHGKIDREEYTIEKV